MLLSGQLAWGGDAVLNSSVHAASGLCYSFKLAQSTSIFSLKVGSGFSLQKDLGFEDL
jgi:hypothetical protein